MSRTDKDIPEKVKKLYAFQEGKIDHDHIPRRDSIKEYTVFDSLKLFSNRDKKGVNEYVSYLKGMGYKVVIEDYKIEDCCKFISVHATRDVQFYSLSNECTTVEFYDHNTDTDIRDGRGVTCSADVPYTYFCPKNVVSRSKARQALRNAMKYIGDDEALDDFSSVSDITNKYGKKVYVD